MTTFRGRELTPNEERLRARLPERWEGVDELTRRQRHNLNLLLNPQWSRWRRFKDKLFPKYGLGVLVEPRRDDWGFVVIVVSILVGFFVAHNFVEFMFTRTPEEAAFLGRSTDIVDPDVRLKIKAVVALFTGFIFWFRAMDWRRYPAKRPELAAGSEVHFHCWF